MEKIGVKTVTRDEISMRSKSEGGMFAIIPAVVLKDETLSWSARMLYGIITWKCNEYAYCWSCLLYTSWPAPPGCPCLPPCGIFGDIEPRPYWLLSEIRNEIKFLKIHIECV